jgi:hypothetical protein
MMSDRKLTTRRFTDQELDYLLEDANTVSNKPWRHGTIAVMVFPHEGAHWQVEVPVHPDEGWQIGSGLVATKVAKVQKTVEVWEPCE